MFDSAPTALSIPTIEEQPGRHGKFALKVLRLPQPAQPASQRTPARKTQEPRLHVKPRPVSCYSTRPLLEETLCLDEPPPRSDARPTQDVSLRRRNGTVPPIAPLPPSSPKLQRRKSLTVLAQKVTRRLLGSHLNRDKRTQSVYEPRIGEPVCHTRRLPSLELGAATLTPPESSLEALAEVQIPREAVEATVSPAAENVDPQTPLQGVRVAGTDDLEVPERKDLLQADARCMQHPRTENPTLYSRKTPALAGPPLAHPRAIRSPVDSVSSSPLSYSGPQTPTDSPTQPTNMSKLSISSVPVSAGFPVSATSLPYSQRTVSALIDPKRGLYAQQPLQLALDVRGHDQILKIKIFVTPSSSSTITDVMALKLKKQKLQSIDELIQVVQFKVGFRVAHAATNIRLAIFFKNSRLKPIPLQLDCGEWDTNGLTMDYILAKDKLYVRASYVEDV